MKTNHKVERNYRISSIMASLSLALMLLTIGGLITFQLAPHTWFFNYRSIEPTEEVFSKGEPLRFTSDAIFKYNFPIDYNDVLKCDFNGTGTFGWFSNFESGQTNPHLGERPPTTWTYNSNIPQGKNKLPISCFLESNITMKFPFGFTKSQEYEGPVFKIVE